MPNHHEYALMACDVYNKFDINNPNENLPLGWEWRIVGNTRDEITVEHNPDIEFQVAAYCHVSENKLVIAFRGTIPFTFREIFLDFTGSGLKNWLNDNIPMIMGRNPNSRCKANDFIDKILGEYPDHDIYITGHSLGAAVGEITAWHNARIKEAVTFESPGTKYYTINERSNPVNKDLKIYTYLTVPNAVNTLTEHTALIYENGEIFRLHIPHIEPGNWPSTSHTLKCLWGSTTRVVTYWSLGFSKLFTKTAAATSTVTLTDSVMDQIREHAFKHWDGTTGAGVIPSIITGKSVGKAAGKGAAGATAASLPPLLGDYIHSDQHGMYGILQCFNTNGEVREDRHKRTIESWPLMLCADILLIGEKTYNLAKGELREIVPFNPYNAGIHTIFYENYIRELEISRMARYKVEGGTVEWKKSGIGPDHIPGFSLHEFRNDEFNLCRAIIHQMRIIKHDYINTHRYKLHEHLKTKIEDETGDVNWDNDPVQVVKVFTDLILAIVDSKHSSPEDLQFICYYMKDNKVYNTRDNSEKLPVRKFIKIVATGNQFLSIIKHHALKKGAITNHEFMSIPDELSHFTTPGIRAVDVPGDGNCFFHAIARQLEMLNHEHVMTAAQLRQLAIDYMKKNPHEFQGFIIGEIGSYIHRMSIDGTWADNPIIQSLARSLHINIAIHHFDSNVPAHITVQNAPRTMTVAYTGSHYLSLEPTEQQNMDVGTNIDTTVLYVSDIKYDNSVLNNKLLLAKVLKMGGSALDDLLELCKDKSIEYQILLAVEEFGAEKVLEILFGDKGKTTGQEVTLDKIPDAHIQDEQILKAITTIEDIIGKEELANIPGFYQYISTALLNNQLSNSARQVIQIMDNLIGDLQERLDFGILLESSDIDNQATIILTQLEYMFEFVESGVTYVKLPHRYPNFNPDYDFGDGGSSGGNDNSNNNEHNDTDSTLMILPIQGAINYNITVYDM